MSSKESRQLSNFTTTNRHCRATLVMAAVSTKPSQKQRKACVGPGRRAATPQSQGVRPRAHDLTSASQLVPMSSGDIIRAATTAGVTGYRSPPPSLPQPGFQGEKAEGHKGRARSHMPRGASPVHGVPPARMGTDTAAHKNTLPPAQGPPPASASRARVCRPKGHLPLCLQREKGNSPV